MMQPLPQQPSSSELSQITGALRRHALPILGATVLAGAGAYFLSSNQPPVYEASSSMLVEQGGGNTPADSLVSPSPLPQGALAQVLHSPAVVADVVNRLRETSLPSTVVTSTERELRAELQAGTFSKLRVEATGDGPQAGVYVLRARANTPALAQALANAGVAALQQWDVERAQRRLQLARNSLRQQLSVLDQGVENGELIDDGASTQARAQLQRDLAVIGSPRSVIGTLDVVAEAVEPSAPVAPQPRRSALLAALLALLVAGSGAVLLEGQRQRVRGTNGALLPDGAARPLTVREKTGVESAAP